MKNDFFVLNRQTIKLSEILTYLIKIGLSALVFGTLIFYSSCKKSDEVFEPVIELPDIIVPSKCGMLQFDNYQHFEKVYDDLETRLESFEDDLQPQDTITSEYQPLEDFENVNTHSSYRNYIEGQITHMEDNDIDITQQNYPDSLFGGNDELKSIMSIERMYLIGDTIYYHYDDCILIMLKTEDCYLGKEALLNINNGIPMQDVLNDFDYYYITNICESAETPSTRSGGCQDRCGISPRFTSSFVETDGGDSLEVTLTNITGISLSNAAMNFTFIYDTISYNPSVSFLQPSTKFKIVNTGVTQCISVRLDVVGFDNIGKLCRACEERLVCVGGPCPVNFEYFGSIDGGTFTALPPSLPAGVTVTKYTWFWGCGSIPESTVNSTVIHKFPCFSHNGFEVTLEMLLSNNCSSSITQRVYPKDFTDCCSDNSKSFDAYYLPSGNEKIWTRQFHNAFPRKKRLRAISIYWKQKSNGKWRRRRTNQKITYMGNVRIGSSSCCSCDLVLPISGQKQARRKRKKFRYTYKVQNVPRGENTSVFFGDEWRVRYEFGNNYQEIYNTRITADGCN